MILDTNALSAFLAGDDLLKGVLGSFRVIHLPVIVLGEHRFGLLRSRHRKNIEPLLDRLEAIANILPVDSGTVRPYAEIRDQLKRAGTPIPANDAWIAALALQHDLPVVSRDTHFDAVKRVRRVKW